MITQLLINIIFLQLIPIARCKTVELTCPNIHAGSNWKRSLSYIQQSSSLDRKCLLLNISVNVENILADPTYILPQDNVNAISDGIKRTFSDCNVFIESPDCGVFKDWVIDDQCYQSSSYKTVNKRKFAVSQYITHCNYGTLNINELDQTITCQFTLPASIVYVFHLQQINLNFNIKSYVSIKMQAIVTEYPIMMETCVTEFGCVGVSRPVVVSPTDTNKQHEFIFDAYTARLLQSRKYLVTFEIIEVSGNNYHQSIKFENVGYDEIITISKPDSCTLAGYISVTSEMQWGLNAVCNDSLAEPERQLLESTLFQNHSSLNHVSLDIWNSLEKGYGGSSRHLLGLECEPFCKQGGDSGGNTNQGGSLIAVFSNGTVRTIANDKIFPSFEQCVVFDKETRRIFSVGGNDKYGNALDRIAVYYLKGQTLLVRKGTLKLDKPRAMTTCYYYKRNYDEYIIAVNGMKHIKHANNPAYWYNDIVFIPLDVNKKDCSPVVKLKFNVVDPKTFITENNILYLIGGRNGQRSTDIIQMVDLDLLFKTYKCWGTPLYGYSNKEYTTLTTHERMAPMKLDRVLPLADFPFVVNQTCMVTYSGQKYFNGKWTSINDSSTLLQLYCNELLIGYLNTTRKTLAGRQVVFTEYDNKNVLIVNDDYNHMIKEDGILVYYYNFTNDGRMYKFSAEFRICFDDSYQAQNKINFFRDFTVDKQRMLENNILIESQKNYRDWSYGFGKVNIVYIDITEPKPYVPYRTRNDYWQKNDYYRRNDYFF